MHHATPLITTIVGGLVLAFILGMIANKLRISPLVGYLLAGVLAGPFTPGFVADTKLAPELAELGVILLMFGVGLHFSLKDLMAVKSIAIPGAIAQIAVATLLGMALSAALGWSLMTGIVFGLCLSTASTVVSLRALEERQLIDSQRGQIAIGWLIVEDLVMVLTLVLLPAIAGMAEKGNVGFASLAPRPRDHHWQSGGLYRHYDAGRPPAGAVDHVAQRRHRLTRAVHSVGAGPGAGHRLRRRGAV